MENAEVPSKVHAEQFWKTADVRATRRGHFWIPGERVTRDGCTFQHGPMFVEWEAPPQVTQPLPVVLVHGGTLQGTEWMETPDGRPGWSQRLVEAGYAVFLADRPCHGRSPYHPEVMGPPAPPFSYERARDVYFPAGTANRHTQFPFDPEQDAASFDAFMAPYGPLPADFALSQEMDADRLGKLLDRIGPAVVVTHSASGPSGWLLAARKPELVAAIVSIEPMGPAFGQTPGFGPLSWGLTSAPVAYDPPRATPEEARDAEPSTLRIPALTRKPMLVVTGETSHFVPLAPGIVEFLKTAGAAAEHLHLPSRGIHGNGHGLIYEKNSDEALQPVLDWIAVHTASFREAAEIELDSKAERGGSAAQVFILYRGNAHTRFDRQYYREQHLPLVMRSWQRHGLHSVTALYPEQAKLGIIAVCVCDFRDEDAMAEAFASEESGPVMADVIHFTDSSPSRSRGLPL